MVDLYGKDKGNISLPASLQPPIPETEKGKEKEQRWGKKKVEVEEPTIFNLQTAFYDARISDIESRIKRLENRNDELLIEIEEVGRVSSEKDAKTADEISSLAQQVASENRRLDEYKEQIDQFEKLRVQEKIAFEKKIIVFQKKYQEKRLELISQIKVLETQINWIEEFKKTQAILQEKWDLSEHSMVSKEQIVKQALEKANRKSEYDKEMLKKEMYTHLLDLAAVFQLKVAKHLNLPIQRLMRENVMLKNDFVIILKEKVMAEQAYDELNELTEKRRKSIIDYISRTKENLIKMKFQKALLKFLEKCYKNLEGRLGQERVLEPQTIERSMYYVEKAKGDEEKINFRLSRLKVLLHKERRKIGIGKYLRKSLDCKIKKVVRNLYDLKFAMMCALEGPEKVDSVVEMNYREFLFYLRKAIRKERCTFVKSVATILHSKESTVDRNLEMTFEEIDELFERPESLDVVDDDLDFSKTREISSESLLKDEDFEPDSLSAEPPKEESDLIEK